jgi:hypothetical protein
MNISYNVLVLNAVVYSEWAGIMNSFVAFQL